MTILEVLSQEHDEVKALLEKAEATKENDTRTRDTLAVQIKEALLPHAHAEEQTLYRRLNETDDDARDLVDEARDEHAEAEMLVRELCNTDSSSREWLSTAKKLKRAIDHHVTEEETEMFKKAEDILSEQEMEEIMIEYEREKQAVYAVVS